MKTRIVTNMFIAAFVVVFFIGEIAGAKSIKVALEDEVMCRNDVLVDGIVSNPGDRYCIRGNEAEWSVSGGNEFLDGIMIVVLNANMDGPPPFFTINGVAFGSFELFPDQYPESSWVGTYNSFYENGIVKSSFVGHGTGDLDGLKMKSYDEWTYDGIKCSAEKYRPFTVEIHDPQGEFF